MLCTHTFPMSVSKLIEVERSLQGMTRRSGIQRRLASVLEEDWRTREDLLLASDRVN